MGDISLAVGPQSCSCKEIVKTLQRHSKLLPCSLISVLSESETHQNLSVLTTGFKSRGQDFTTVCNAYQGTGKEKYVSVVGVNFQFLTGRGNLSSVPTQSSTSFPCKVSPEVLPAHRQISATASGCLAKLESEKRFFWG